MQQPVSDICRKCENDAENLPIEFFVMLGTERAWKAIEGLCSGCPHE